MKQFFKIYLFCLMVSFTIMPYTVKSALAAAAAAPNSDIAPQPCDTDYWDTLTSRAWLEAEREIMQNQNLIFKADSVLEYTCFDRFSAASARFAGEIFSDEDGVQRLDAGLLNTVNNPTLNYIIGNFIHTYLGGRAPEYATDPPNRVLDFAAGAYACEEMAGVWQSAKCANLLHTAALADIDGFYPFIDLLGFQGSPDVAGYTDIDETRLFPLACGGPGRPWASQYIIAGNVGDALYPFEVPLGTVYEEVFERLDPAVCLDPILTGVRVITSTGDQGADGVCTNPGCTYVGGGCAP